MILRNPLQLVLDSVNALNSIDLTLDNVVFSDPHPPATQDEIYFALGRNTVATLTGKDGAPGLGRDVVYYERLDISLVFASYGSGEGEYITLPVDLDNVQTAKDVIPALVYYYGYYMTPADVEPVLIDHANGSVLLRFEPSSPGYIGEIRIKLISGGAFLAPNFPVVQLEGPYEYPYFNTKVGQGSVYAYGYAFDDYAAELKAITAQNINRDRLAAILAAVTNHPWEVFRIPSEYNLKEATVVYNGPNQSTFKSNPLAENVLIINLSLYCINLGGQMILHYADPA